jgi:hypothetical protein
MAAGLSLPTDSVDPFALHYWPSPAEDINDERSPWTASEDVVSTRHLDPTILQRGGSYMYPSAPTPGGCSSEPSMTDASSFAEQIKDWEQLSFEGLPTVRGSDRVFGSAIQCTQSLT